MICITMSYMFLIKDNGYVFVFTVFLICLGRLIQREEDVLSRNFAGIIGTLGCLRLVLSRLAFDQL